jgi:hypothetical protein
MRSGRAGRGRKAAATLVTFAALAAAACAPASAAVQPPRSTPGPSDPGRWVETGFSPLPFDYYQGITTAPTGEHFFDGFTVGLYRTDADLNETARNANAIPADVAAAEGYNHIGDLDWDGGEGGRVLLPLECYLFGVGNFCGTGSIGIADPQTLAWRYYVKLDSADIKKAMWVEVSPDGTLFWTSDRRDLLAYRMSDLTPANAAPAAAPIKPVRRLVDAVPPSGVTGATFHRGRLFLAGQDVRPFQVWSIDTETGERRLELERVLKGESEGLDTFTGLGGVLHWQIGEIAFPGPPTYDHTAVIHFAPVNHPPDCTAVHAAPSTLWPPNGKLVRVTLAGATDPDGDPAVVMVKSVTQDEPVRRALPDAVIPNEPGAVLLRAKRRGSGDGRVYRIAFEATDGVGGSCEGTTTVAVPHDRHGRGPGD